MMTNTPLLFGIPDSDIELFSRHYLFDVLPKQKDFQELDIEESFLMVQKLISENDLSGKRERNVEIKFLTKVFDVLGLQYEPAIQLGAKEIDYVFFTGEKFSEDFSNTIGICEAKREKRIEKQYFIRKNDNSDPIFQTQFYLKEVNNRLHSAGSERSIDFALLTDGQFWRIYSRFHTGDNREFESHFLQFDLFSLFELKDEEEKKKLFKIWFYLLRKEAWETDLLNTYRQAKNISQEVTKELKKQALTSLELISTGIWRKMNYSSFKYKDNLEKYGIDIERIDDPKVKHHLFEIIYEESVIYLLRLLFLLYAEDRGLMEPTIKKQGGILEAIRGHKAPIGHLLSEFTDLQRNYDVEISEKFEEIDKKYNGGIFSNHKHPLIFELNIDDTLFANAIDNLCRVYVGKKKEKEAVTVDFGSISVRELGTMYESLLEYKLSEVQEDIKELSSIVDKDKVRLEVKKGDLELINSNGERKASGSYYTHDLLVAHLVQETLEKRIHTILNENISYQEKKEKILALNICDPAMGSGHFLIEAFDTVRHALSQLEEEAEEQGQDIGRTGNLAIIRKCIFGVDLNHLAVEIAKMTLWIKTFEVNRPLEFFDANLKCGNSLVGIYDKEQKALDDLQQGFFQNTEDLEREIAHDLALEVQKVLSMPSATIEEIKAKEEYYKDHVVRLQKSITFLYHFRLLKYLNPEIYKRAEKEKLYDEFVEKIKENRLFLYSIYERIRKGTQLSAVPEKEILIKEVLSAIEEVSREYHPFHWKIEFPHIFLEGGFDIILGNPPWEKVKPNHNEFFSDYIQGYKDMETKVSKKLSEELCQNDIEISEKWKVYNEVIEQSNAFFKDGYEWQVIQSEEGKKLSGDNDLYKIFIEKAFTILKEGGSCGFVIPSGLNTDQGTSGLRKLLFEQSKIESLFMFENRRGIFESVHRQYKFDALIYSKNKPKDPLKQRFECGFYWLDPQWLHQSEGWQDTTGKLEYKEEKKIHEKFKYPLHLSHIIAPDTKSLIEIRGKKDIPIIEKMAQFPLLGSKEEEWYIRTYTEFHMTKDSDLFLTEEEGYPLYQGKTIHQFENNCNPVEKWVISKNGEERLAQRWKIQREELPNRRFRIGAREISRSTDKRTLISTIIPPYVFCGNKITFIEIKGIEGKSLESGLITYINSVVLDLLIRFRVSTTVNAFYIKQLPVPRDTSLLASLGKKAMPLFAGRDFEDFREGIPEETDPQKRMHLKAELDAEVAHIYGIEYEELQHILTRFPLVEDEYKEEVLRAYRKRG